jgi:hypothetical protein
MLLSWQPVYWPPVDYQEPVFGHDIWRFNFDRSTSFDMSSYEVSNNFLSDHWQLLWDLDNEFYLFQKQLCINSMSYPFSSGVANILRYIKYKLLLNVFFLFILHPILKISGTTLWTCVCSTEGNTDALKSEPHSIGWWTGSCDRDFQYFSQVPNSFWFMKTLFDWFWRLSIKGF